MITLIDYGVSHLGSDQNMLKKLGTEHIIVHDIAKMENGTKLILPSAGVFDSSMSQLKASGPRSAMDAAVHDCKVPVSGICLNIQHMTDGSEDGQLTGLGWVPTHTVRFMPAICRHWRRTQFATWQAGDRLGSLHSMHARCRREKLKAEVE